MRKFTTLFIILLTIFSLAIRLYRFDEPPKYYFDEVYHAVTAKAYADNNPAPYDPFSPAPKEGTAYDWLHPPLAKLIQAASIKVFGDVPIGWRLPSVIFGTAIIPATFFLANVLFGPAVAIFAATVVAFENLTFVMSRITMNDVFVTFFAVMAFGFAALYVKLSSLHKPTVDEWHESQKVGDYKLSITKSNKYLWLTAIFLGLSVGSKWTGVYAIAAIFVYVFYSKIRSTSEEFLRLRSGPPSEVFKLYPLIIVPIILYLASYGQYFLQGHSFIYLSDIKALVLSPFSDVRPSYKSDFIKLHQQIWWYQNRHDLKHSYGTTPLYCVPEGLTAKKNFCSWALNIRGVYFSYEQYGDKAGYIYAFGNPLIFWFGIGAISYLIAKFFQEKKKEYFLILLGYFIFWIPFIFTPRLLFLYHYLPSIPFLSVAIGLGLSTLYKQQLKVVALVILAVFILAFFYFYPITSGWPIEPASIDKYMWLKTWR